MSDDCCTDTGCSMDTAGDNGTCTDTVLSSDIDTTTSVETVILKHKIDSAVDDSISNHQSTSLNSPISTDDVGAQTISDGNSSQTQKSKRSKAANFWPCIRIVVFILIIIVLLLILKMSDCGSCGSCGTCGSCGSCGSCDCGCFGGTGGPTGDTSNGGNVVGAVIEAALDAAADYEPAPTNQPKKDPQNPDTMPPEETETCCSCDSCCIL